MPVKNEGLNRHSVSLRRNMIENVSFFQCFWTGSDEKPGPSYATAVRGLERYCTALSLQPRKGLSGG